MVIHVILAVALGLLIVGITVVDYLHDEFPTGRERREANLRRQVHAVTRQLDQDHDQARRAMNDAAGQSWRNLIE